jgi:SulP family sulfate permease
MRHSLHHLPFVSWLKEYRTSFFRRDVISGITVAVVLIPQAMAYAMLAGLPPVYGLYAATVTPLIAALWGSLRQLATGPIAIMSLLVLTSLTPLAEPGSREFIELAFLLSFMVGVFYLGIGLFPLIIIATQLPHFLGFTVPRHEYIFSMLFELVKGVPSLHAPTLVVGLAAFAMIYGIKRYRSNFPAGLMALALASCAVLLFELNETGVAIVGKIPLVSFAETYSVGKAISAQTKQRVNVDQEFIGQGLANLIGSFFQSYPVSGSFSRTAINYAAGAKTGIASGISSLIVILALLFLTPLFTYIPRAALAALGQRLLRW